MLQRCSRLMQRSTAGGRGMSSTYEYRRPDLPGRDVSPQPSFPRAGPSDANPLPGSAESNDPERRKIMYMGVREYEKKYKRNVRQMAKERGWKSLQYDTDEEAARFQEEHWQRCLQNGAGELGDGAKPPRSGFDPLVRPKSTQEYHEWGRGGTEWDQKEKLRAFHIKRSELEAERREQLRARWNATVDAAKTQSPLEAAKTIGHLWLGKWL